MAYSFDDVKTICQEAFYLLRQDGSTLIAANWSAGSPIEVAKCKLALDTAIHEVLDEYRWTGSPTADNIGSWPHRLKNALVYCLARELAIPIAGRMEDMKAMDSLYRDKVLQAKISDFEAGKATVTEWDTRSLFALITVNAVHGDGKVPASFADIKERIDVLRDNARRDVLLAQDWNFCKVVDRVNSDEQNSLDADFPFCVPYPMRALRLVSVGSMGSESNEWKVEGGYILAKHPISSIRYTKDVTDFTKWRAFAKNAYIHRLAADVARTVMNNAQDAAMQEQAYTIALENARLRDSRESSTPTDAWGENFYAKQMTGGTRRALDI